MSQAGTARQQISAIASGLGASPAGSALPGNPFVNSAQFLPVSYQVPPAAPPVAITPGSADLLPFAQTVADSGVAIEMWVKAASPGILVAQNMVDPNQTAVLAPLLYIDVSGLLRGGLFQAGQPLLLGANSLATPVPIVDGDWHHVALSVAAPNTTNTTPGQQCLYLDGRLVDTADGTFLLEYTDSEGNNYWPTGPAQLGGALPSTSSAPPQAFTGCMNEIRTWVPQGGTPPAGRSATQIQQLLDLPLCDVPQDLQQGLFAHFGPQQWAELGFGSNSNMVISADAPPFDPFTLVTNRVPGYQNYGLYNAVPFSCPKVNVAFQPFLMYSTKITLRQGDSVQIAFPTLDNNDVLLAGTFSVTATIGSNGSVLPQPSNLPGTVVTFTAAVTGVYRLDFTYSVPDAYTIGLVFTVLAGPNNPLMQLLLTLQPSQQNPAPLPLATYSDPAYPVTAVEVPNPRPGESGMEILPAYWPVFTDTTVFPIPAGATYGATDLFISYLELVSYLQEKPNLNPTFGDFFVLHTNGAAIVDPSDLSNYLDTAYQGVTGQAPPQPGAPYQSAYDQVYAFLYNVNTIRNNVDNFLTYYQQWAQSNIDYLALSSIPKDVALTIYNNQQTIGTATLQGPTGSELATNIVVGSLIWGVGAALVPLTGGWSVAGIMAASFVTSGGANCLSELFGLTCGSSTVKPSLESVNYTTLDAIANETTNQFDAVYTSMYQQLTDSTFRQLIYSNYGLLLALAEVNSAGLFDGTPSTKSAIHLTQNENALQRSLTYSSWRALVPAVFRWTAAQLENSELPWDMRCTFVPDGSPYNSSNFPGFPQSLPINQVFVKQPALLQHMLQSLQDWQSQDSKDQPPVNGAPFFSIAPFSFTNNEQHDLRTGGMIFTWYLADQYGNPMNLSLTSQLFGVGKTPVTWTPVDQNYPFEAVSGGWYWNVEPLEGAVTYPYDAFANWAVTAPSSYSGGALIADLSHYKGNDNSPNYTAQSANATDTPPLLQLTVSANALDFGVQTLNSTVSLTIVVTNAQYDSLIGVSVSVSGAGFSQTNSGDSVGLGSPCTISVSFTPTQAGPCTGTLTIATSQSSTPIVVALSGIGVAAAASGNIVWLGDMSYWNQGFTIYGFQSYEDAFANWSTGQNSIFTTQLTPQQGAQVTGLPSAWLAISGNMPGGVQLFMIVYYCNDVFLELSADGQQASVGNWQVSWPTITPNPGTITLGPGQDVWNQGLTYAIFPSCEDALENWNTQTNATASGQLGSGGGTASSLPSGWLVLYGQCQGVVQPYIVTQYFNDITVLLAPDWAQALFFVG